jgi:hypothetical protein
MLPSRRSERWANDTMVIVNRLAWGTWWPPVGSFGWPLTPLKVEESNAQRNEAMSPSTQPLDQPGTSGGVHVAQGYSSRGRTAQRLARGEAAARPRAYAPPVLSLPAGLTASMRKRWAWHTNRPSTWICWCKMTSRWR